MSKSEHYGEGLIARVPGLLDKQYLANCLDELGRCQSSGMGISKVSWSDVKAYAEMTGASKWECQLLHYMSKLFVDARNLFSDNFYEPPYLYGGYTFQVLSADAADRRRRK